eukprot:2479034-Prymnesium_polylepis.1
MPNRSERSFGNSPPQALRDCARMWTLRTSPTLPVALGQALGQRVRRPKERQRRARRQVMHEVAAFAPRQRRANRCCNA